MPCGLLLLMSGFVCFQDTEAIKFSKYQPKKTMILKLKISSAD